MCDGSIGQCINQYRHKAPGIGKKSRNNPAENHQGADSYCKGKEPQRHFASADQSIHPSLGKKKQRRRGLVISQGPEQFPCARSTDIENQRRLIRPIREVGQDIAPTGRRPPRQRRSKSPGYPSTAGTKHAARPAPDTSRFQPYRRSMSFPFVVACTHGTLQPTGCVISTHPIFTSRRVALILQK